MSHGEPLTACKLVHERPLVRAASAILSSVASYTSPGAIDTDVTVEVGTEVVGWEAVGWEAVAVMVAAGGAKVVEVGWAAEARVVSAVEAAAAAAEMEAAAAAADATRRRCP